MLRTSVRRAIATPASRALCSGRVGGYYGALSKEQPYFSALAPTTKPPGLRGMLSTAKPISPGIFPFVASYSKFPIFTISSTGDAETPEKVVQEPMKPSKHPPPRPSLSESSIGQLEFVAVDVVHPESPDPILQVWYPRKECERCPPQLFDPEEEEEARRRPPTSSSSGVPRTPGNVWEGLA